MNIIQYLKARRFGNWTIDTGPLNEPRRIFMNPPYAHPDVKQQNTLVAPLVTFTVVEPSVTRVVAPQAKPLAWLESIAVCVPKSIREPFVGDLREDLTGMIAAGRSGTAVRWAAISQVAILIVRWVWSNVGRLVGPG